MTELEKKADKYAYEVYSTRPLGDDPTDDEIKEAYIQGYTDAMAWHYPSKGELPTEKKLLLIKIPGCYFIGWYENNNWFMDDGEMTVLKCTVSRWQYIIPPKEEA